MMRVRTFLLPLVLTLPALAIAQWAWVDGSGRKVFSDQPPPLEVPQKNILRQPAARAPAAIGSMEAPAAAAAPPALPASAAPAAATGRDRELEARRRQAEAAEADKRKAEEERIARLKADNCSRAKSAKATLDSGVRIARTNDKGEREILDDAARVAEARRLQDVIARDCAGA